MRNGLKTETISYQNDRTTKRNVNYLSAATVYACPLQWNLITEVTMEPENAGRYTEVAAYWVKYKYAELHPFQYLNSHT
jgi:hypothetical protein